MKPKKQAINVLSFNKYFPEFPIFFSLNASYISTAQRINAYQFAARDKPSSIQHQKAIRYDLFFSMYKRDQCGCFHKIQSKYLHKHLQQTYISLWKWKSSYFDLEALNAVVPTAVQHWRTPLAKIVEKCTFGHRHACKTCKTGIYGIQLHIAKCM